MTLLFGEYALSGAMLTSLAIVLAAFAYLQLRNDGLIRAIRWGTALLAGLLCVSVWGLLKALVEDNFALQYVAEHSEKALPLGYKLAAFWAGQQGSLLFWAWVLGLMGLMMAWRLRRADDAATAVSLAVMAAVTGFFTCVMLLATNADGTPAGNPFYMGLEHPVDGHGLNAQLQNLAMVVHPPMLFLGYAGFTAPFALMVGGLFSRQKDGRWLALARPWMVFSWIALTVGIVLGAQWAYVELGWGGYWAWDPVENASLFPWLTGTALLHSAILQTKRGMFKRWTVTLTAASFLLCVLGTYLTRSGVIQSVHGFPQSSIGTFFLMFMGLIVVGSLLLILLRLDLLVAEHPLEAIISREGFFLAGNVLLVIMTLTTLVGTLYPLISGVFGAPITVDKAFYNNVILPMALVLAALMSTGPILGSGAEALDRARTKLGAMFIAGFVAAVAMGLWDFGSVGAMLSTWGAVFTHFGQVLWRLIRLDKTPVPWEVGPDVMWLWMQAAALVVVAIVSGVVIDIYGTLRGPRGGVSNGPLDAAANENLSASASVSRRLMRTMILRHRHWGAQIAHLGLAAIVAGVAGSSVHGQSKILQLHPGAAGPVAERSIGEYTLELVGLNEVRRGNHTAAVATITFKSPKETFQLKPERRFYDVDPQQGNTEVALRPGILSDVYVTLAGWEKDGSTVSITALINPLVNWIWIGGGLLTLGGLVCLIFPGRPAPVVPAPETSPVPEPVVLTGKNKRERQRARTLTDTTIAGRH